MPPRIRFGRACAYFLAFLYFKPRTQQLTSPEVPPAESKASSRHVPLVLSRLNVASDSEGRNAPLNGADPVWMKVGAEPSKIVNVPTQSAVPAPKSLPAPPTPLARRTYL